MQAFYKLSWIPSLMVIVGLMFVASCKDDDEPPKAFISFETEESEIRENDGTIDITVKLDRAASEAIVLSFSLGGTATKLSSAGGDYDVVPDGTITIAKGDSEADIAIEVFEDSAFEVDFSGEEVISSESVILTITGVVSGPGEIGEEGLIHTLSIFEDDLLVILDWEESGTSDVDMDLFYWADDPNDDIEGFTLISGSAAPGNESEGIVLRGDTPDYDFGFSYVYYEGSNDDLDFASFFINFGGTVDGDIEVITEGKYDLDNRNPYDPETGDPTDEIVQTVSKSGLDYVNLSSIRIPDAGSRQNIIWGNFGNINRGLIRSNPQIQRVKVPRSFINGLRK